MIIKRFQASLEHLNLPGGAIRFLLRTPCFATIMCTNNEKNDQFYRKVAFLMYSERVNFRPQSWKEASKLKPHRGLGTRLPSP